ncbi:hypothetical protein SOMG_00035 [Schizosaccharomyces osmophilus]|uniref:Uncharacterized protein n=1 Tax=Schizosaccharomyces osmophilus TaxID=2545709 RepID=A0AAE9W9X3_9SCHI|nr:uncharacterized protein SOMG_00035 [Schizosaccharomyces osmophilus]WBW72386.1 hypothetical protein SOMG_00035 [Schizosaccharomyces osmophilus]
MKTSIFLIYFVWFSLGWAIPSKFLSTNDNVNNVETVDYPFYVQKFPYSKNCRGNVSFIMNPPTAGGESFSLSTDYAGSILTVPYNRSSITCTQINAKRKKCYKGTARKCTKIPNFNATVSVFMRDSSHKHINASGISQSYYMLTPNMTYAYSNYTYGLDANGTLSKYDYYLYPCDGNQTCQLRYQKDELWQNDQNLQDEFWQFLDPEIYNEDNFLRSLNAQVNASRKRSNLPYKAPNLKTPVSHKSSASFIRAGKFLYIFLALVTTFSTIL